VCILKTEYEPNNLGYVSEYKYPLHSLFDMHATNGYVLLKSSNLSHRN